MRAAVIGLGKIGLPLAVQFARKGITVIGADINADLVEMINRGASPNEAEKGLGEALFEVVGRKALTATVSTKQAVAAAEVVVIVVPLVVDSDHQPDFAAIDSASAEVAATLRRGHLVIYETTVPVGTVRGRFGNILAQGGLIPGRDFHLAFSPERVFSGRIFQDLRRYPKLVGGFDAASADAAVSFYEQALDFDPRSDLERPNGVWNLGTLEAAELTKLVETTYRDVNIALANEFARYAESIGIDFGEVIEASNSQPYSHVHRPGLVGGHCIPVYPHLYLHGDPAADLPRHARRINEGEVDRVVARTGQELGELTGKTIAVLGAAYRGNVKETAFSAVFPLVAALVAAGANPVVHDPMYSEPELIDLGFTPYQLGEPCEVAILQADHSFYQGLKPADLPGCRLLMDIRGSTQREVWNDAGMTHLQIGRG